MQTRLSILDPGLALLPPAPGIACPDDECIAFANVIPEAFLSCYVNQYPRVKNPSRATVTSRLVAPDREVTSSAGLPLYICRSQNAWESASRWVTALSWKTMATYSDALAKRPPRPAPGYLKSS